MAAEDGAAATRLLGPAARFVGQLTGGQHAVTTVWTDGVDEFVLRRFPPGDSAVTREALVLPKVAPLGALVPRLVAFDDDPAGPSIVTTRVAGRAPDPVADATALAIGMAGVLARIHALDATGLPAVPAAPPPTGGSALAAHARANRARLAGAADVLTHSDFWCGNALWTGDRLTGVVDWCGARPAPRGVDLAWCRQDLVLLGHPDAADVFVAEYERCAGVPVDDLRAWDLHAAARADANVESWAVNYAGIGRPELTGIELRRRFDDWTRELVAAEIR
jgi:aminoglycoside phosphotransferase (APT) family kinase protein